MKTEFFCRKMRQRAEKLYILLFLKFKGRDIDKSVIKMIISHIMLKNINVYDLVERSKINDLAVIYAHSCRKERFRSYVARLAIWRRKIDVLQHFHGISQSPMKLYKKIKKKHIVPHYDFLAFESNPQEELYAQNLEAIYTYYQIDLSFTFWLPDIWVYIYNNGDLATKSKIGSMFLHGPIEMRKDFETDLPKLYLEY